MFKPKIKRVTTEEEFLEALRGGGRYDVILWDGFGAWILGVKSSRDCSGCGFALIPLFYKDALAGWACPICRSGSIFEA